MTRTIVVTGAASGIGQATAEHLDAQGDRVLRLDLREGDVLADLGTGQGRQEAVAKIHELTDTLDGIVTWAGLGGGSPATLLVNYFGTTELIGGVQGLLANSPAPRVVVTSSRMSLFSADASIVNALLAGDAEVVAHSYPDDETEPLQYYKASKTALARWMRRLAVAPGWGDAGIAVNAIAPGLIETPLTRTALDDPAARGPLIDMHPQTTTTMSQPAEIAALTAFLLSEPAGLLAGQCIWADRGTEALVRGDGTW